MIKFQVVSMTGKVQEVKSKTIKVNPEQWRLFPVYLVIAIRFSGCLPDWKRTQTLCVQGQWRRWGVTDNTTDSLMEPPLTWTGELPTRTHLDRHSSNLQTQINVSCFPNRNESEVRKHRGRTQRPDKQVSAAFFTDSREPPEEDEPEEESHLEGVHVHRVREGVTVESRHCGAAWGG